MTELQFWKLIIDGVTCDVIILDEAQKVSDYTWSERIVPMG